MYQFPTYIEVDTGTPPIDCTHEAPKPLATSPTFLLLKDMVTNLLPCFRSKQKQHAPSISKFGVAECMCTCSVTQKQCLYIECRNWGTCTCIEQIHALATACLLPELFLSVWQTILSQNGNETPQIGISSSSGIQNFGNVARCYIHHLLVGEKYHSERNVA